MIKNIATIWLRELTLYVRNKPRLFGSIAMPLFWLFMFGLGFQKSFTINLDINYMQFMFPGVIGMILLFQGVFFGVGILWDRRFGFLKEILVAPISRTSIMIGKTLGGVTTIFVTIAFLVIVAYLYGINFSTKPLNLLYAFLFILLTALAFVSLGITIASRMKDPQGYQIVINFIMLPLFVLSGIFFPITNLPMWLQVISYGNPLVYGVDAIRFFLVGVSSFSIFTDAIVLGIFTTVMVVSGTLLFRKVN